MNNKTQPTTTDTTEARTKRIEQRQQLINTLAYPFWLPFKLVQLGMESQEPVVVDLNFTSQHFPGKYVYEVVALLKTLQEAGLVKLNQSRDITSYEVALEDEIDKAFLEALFS